MKIIIIVAVIILIVGIYTKTTNTEISPPVAVAKESTVGESGKSKYKKISQEKAKEIMDNGEVIILDVRTQEEYNEGYIEGAILIPSYDIKNLAEEQLPDKDATILVYCRSGNRSKTVSKVLVDMGYTDVNDFGGIMSWSYEIVK